MPPVAGQRSAAPACVIPGRACRAQRVGVSPRRPVSSRLRSRISQRRGELRMRTLTPVLCTSGLAAEARIARAAGFQVIVGAGDPRRTAELVEAAARHAKCLVSFGIAGGLAPHLQPGDVIVSGEVIGEDRRWGADPRFHHEVVALARQINAAEGPVLGASDILALSPSVARMALAPST